MYRLPNNEKIVQCIMETKVKSKESTKRRPKD